MPGARKSRNKHNVGGTFRKDRHGRTPIGARLMNMPKPPASLGADAIRYWRRLARLLIELGTIRRADLVSLELLCETLATIESARRTIEAEGVTVTSRGAVKAHPALQVLATARAQAAILLGAFGLTPAARSRVEELGVAVDDDRTAAYFTDAASASRSSVRRKVGAPH